MAVTRRRTLPFGADRGTVPSGWVGDKGFVGGTKDNTGLTHLGAREYDPALGRFISVDPVMDLSIPDQWNGYSYGNDNPVTLSDPSGTRPCYSEANDCSLTPPASTPSKPSTNPGGKTPPASNPPAPSSPGQASTWKNVVGGGLNGAWKTVFFKPIKLPGIYIPWVSDWEYEKSEQVRMGLEGWFGADPTSDAYKRSDTGAQIGIGVATIAKSGAGWVAKMGSKGLSALTGKGGAIVAEKATAAGSQALAKCAANSFAAGTLVLMGDGSRQPIEDIEVGDTVMATDPKTGESGPQTVLELHVNQDTDLTDLTVRDSNGATSLVHTTDEHPFWNTTTEEWTDADSLEAGDGLRSTTAPGPTVTQVGSFAGAATMHNLTVEGIHSYYVMAGKSPALVHNCGEFARNYGSGMVLAEMDAGGIHEPRYPRLSRGFRCANVFRCDYRSWGQR